MHKKRNNINIENHRTVNLLNQLYKLDKQMITLKMEEMKLYQPRGQAVFQVFKVLLKHLLPTTGSTVFDCP